MLRGVGNRQAGPLRQNFNAALALGELLQQFQPVGMAQRFRDRGELGEQRLFGTCVDMFSQRIIIQSNN